MILQPGCDIGQSKGSATEIRFERHSSADARRARSSRVHRMGQRRRQLAAIALLQRRDERSASYNTFGQIQFHRQSEPDLCDTKARSRCLNELSKASSNEDDLVLDCFGGSGTTAAVAEKLNRRWIACDLGRFAIHTTRKRLLSIPNVRPFVVQNLGKYERQAWAGAEFGEANGNKCADAPARLRRLHSQALRAPRRSMATLGSTG